MSETVRTYTGLGAPPTRRGILGRRRGRLTVLIIALIVIGYGWWTTRDTYPMERLIPANQSYYLFASDVLHKRGALAESAIWHAFPPDTAPARIPALLNQSLGMPEWILNNLVPDVCCASGKDLRAFREVLFVSRMTRIGCILQQFRRFIPGVQSDPAGGLRLSRVADAGVYFAVRGRMLAVSPSRDALIRALALPPEDAIRGDTLQTAWKSSATEDVQGTIALSPTDPLGNVFKSLRFAVRVEAAAARVKCRGAFNLDGKPQWAALVANLTPQELATPPEGMLQVSMNFGQRAVDLWTAAVDAFGQKDAVDTLWQQWSALAPLQFGATLFAPLGPGIRFAWCGVDLNEMAPVPEIVATLDADPAFVRETFAALPPLADGTDRYSFRPQYDAEKKRVRLPLIGGPSMEPTAGLSGNALLISSSRLVADRLLDAESSIVNRQSPLPQRGNLHVAINPRACLEAIVGLGSLLAENSLLKDYTRDSLQAFAAPWLTGAATVKEISAQASCEKGEITAELAVDCVPNAS